MSEYKAIVPQFSTPGKVALVCDQMQKVETARAQDRAMIDNLANGGRPFTADEVKKYNIQINVNWGVLSEKLRSATGQLNNAFIPNGNFFTAHSLGGEPAKREEYSQKFTKNINSILKRFKSGKKHHYILRSRNASVGLHGIGPLLWTNDSRLLPRYVPLEDLLIPTDTSIDLSSNLTHFCVNLYLTAGELFRMACLPKDAPGWNKPAVIKILTDLKDDTNVPLCRDRDGRDFWERPEAMNEWYKQNAGYLESDTVSKVKLRSFYYQDPEKQKWYRKIILRQGTPSVGADQEFIFEDNKPFADHIDDVLHIQFGDNSLVPPLKYHSVRGIGQLLYAPAETLNRLQCQAVQHVFQNLLTWFKINDPTDRDRLKQILLQQYGVMPEGASIVPENERHQIDPRLLDFGIAQMRQNVADNSTSFTPGSDNGTKKEMTAFEAKARLQNSNAMVSNVLGMMYQQEIFYYEQLVKRAVKKNTDDPTCQKFQEMCRKDGIPDELMVLDNWRIITERVVGSGDNTLAQAQADALMGQITGFDADSQRKIRRLWTGITLDDPERAQDLVKDAPDEGSSGTRAAEDVYATLMRGIALQMRQGIDQIGYCGALLSMMEVEIQKILQTDGMGTQDQINGFVTVADNVELVLQFIAQDKRNKAVVKQLNDELSNSLNEVKGMAQRHSEQQGQQNGQPDPESMAKAQSTMLLAQTKADSTKMLADLKAHISNMNAQMKLAQNHAKFMQKQEQEMQKHTNQQNLQAQEVHLDVIDKGIRTGADVAAQKAKTEAQVAASKAATKTA